MAGSAEQRRVAVIAGLAILCAAVAALISFQPLQVAAALPLTLFLPGYALAAAAFEPGAIPRSQRLVMALALSLAVLAIGAVILDQTPGGIQAAAWAILLATVTVAGCAIAWWRGAESSAAPRLRVPRTRASDLALITGALLAVGGAAVIARTPLPAEHVVGYTSLSMQHARSGGAPGLKVQVESNEKVRIGYRLVLSQRRGPNRATARFSLPPGGSYEEFVPLSRFLRGDRPRLVTARLYRLDRPSQAYRRVNAWIE